MVAIDDFSLFTDKNGPVGVPVQRNTDMGAMPTHGLLQALRMHGSAAVIDVHSIRSICDHFNFCAEFAENGWSDLIRGTVGTVHHQLDPLKIEISGKRAFDEFNIPAFGIIDTIGLSDRVRRRAKMFDLVGNDQLFDARL